MPVDKEKDGRGTICVKLAKSVSVINISSDVVHRLEGNGNIGSVMPGQKNSGNYLTGEKQPRQGSVTSIIGDVSRSRIPGYVIGQGFNDGVFLYVDSTYGHRKISVFAAGRFVLHPRCFFITQLLRVVVWATVCLIF